VDVAKKLWMLRGAQWFMRGLFYSYAKILGLRHYHLPDMDHIAKISHAFYDNNLRGGEGHMEVGKLIHNVVDQKVNMTLSIKPFGCMPSGAVSDGVQSLITELFPQAIFLPIETNGDGAVNVYSRVQMQLFKARQVAEKQVAEKLQELGWSQDELRSRVNRNKRLRSATYCSPHAGACTAMDLVSDVAERRAPLIKRLGAWLNPIFDRASKRKNATLSAVAKAAERYQQGKNQASGVQEMAVKFVEPA
jgi:hypothetical protein